MKKHEKKQQTYDFCDFLMKIKGHPKEAILVPHPRVLTFFDIFQIFKNKMKSWFGTINNYD